MHALSHLHVALLLLTACTATAPTGRMTIPLHAEGTRDVPVFDGELPPESHRNGRLEFVHTPRLDVYRAPPATANGTAIVICPGGGYRILAADHEGAQIAEWLNGLGITAIVLKYRMYPYRHPVPMHDVQRAVRVTRAQSAAWGVDPARIGVMGFSAGGHLASTAATCFAEADPASEDPVERVSSRPDFAVLVYPVIQLTGEHGHRGSAANLLGADAGEEQRQLWSSDRNVSERSPPTFVVHSEDDRVVPIENSRAFVRALHEHGVSGTLVEFGTGGHGYGLGRANGETRAWPGMCAAWMRAQGLLGRSGD